MTPDALRAIITHEIPNMEGWTTPEVLLQVTDLILAQSITRVVELGTFGGRFLVAAGLALKHQGVGQVFGIDPWKNACCLEGETPENQDWWAKVDLHQMHRLTVEAIWRHGLDDVCVPIRCQSQFALDLFPHNSVEFLFLDGNHSEIASTRDAANWLPKLRRQGYLLMDDCNWPTTAKAQAIIETACQPVAKLTPDGKFRLFQKC